MSTLTLLKIALVNTPIVILITIVSVTLVTTLWVASKSIKLVKDLFTGGINYKKY